MRVSIAALGLAALLSSAAPTQAELVATSCTINNYKNNTTRSVNCKWRQSTGHIQVWLKGRKRPFRFHAKGQGKRYVRINTSDRITLTRIGKFTLTIWKG